MSSASKELIQSKNLQQLSNIYSSLESLPKESDQEEVKPLYKNFISGGFGGTCGVVCGQPLDTIKVRLQTMRKQVRGRRPEFTGTFDCLRKTVRNEGFRSLYKGMGAPVAVRAPIFATLFSSFGFAKSQVLDYRKDPHHKLAFFENFLCGAFAGLFSSAIAAPSERIKCLLQVQRDSGKKIYSGPFDCFQKLYREGGARSLFRGTSLTLCRNVPAFGVYFAGYEAMKQVANQEDGSSLSPVHVIIAGGTAGCMFWSVAIVPDGLKTRFQTAPNGKYKNIKQLFVDVVRKEGLRGLFRGFVPVMLRAFPANVTSFLAYELAQKFLCYV